METTIPRNDVTEMFNEETYTKAMNKIASINPAPPRLSISSACDVHVLVNPVLETLYMKLPAYPSKAEDITTPSAK